MPQHTAMIGSLPEAFGMVKAMRADGPGWAGQLHLRRRYDGIGGDRMRFHSGTVSAYAVHDTRKGNSQVRTADCGDTSWRIRSYLIFTVGISDLGWRSCGPVVSRFRAP